MTKQQQEDYENARSSLEHIPAGSASRKIWERILADWKQKDEQLECVGKTVVESIPKLDEAFRRYGCDEKKCETACGRGWPCQANGIRIVANDLRDCLGIIQ